MPASVESLKAKIDDPSEKGFQGNVGSVRKAVAKAKALSAEEKASVVAYAEKKFSNGAGTHAPADAAPKKQRVAKKQKTEKAEAAPGAEPKRRGRPPGIKNKKTEAVAEDTTEVAAPPRRRTPAASLASSADVTTMVLEAHDVLGQVRVAVAELNTSMRRANIQDNDMVVRSSVIRDIAAAVQSLSGSLEQTELSVTNHGILEYADATLKATMERYPALRSSKPVPSA